MSGVRANKTTLRLATNNGHRIGNGSGDSPASLNRHVTDTKLPLTENFDLKGAPLGNFAGPHRHGLPADLPTAGSERTGQRLMGSAEVVKDFLEGSHAHPSLKENAPSVSTLPSTVKRLTTSTRRGVGKLSYMQKKRTPRDEWAIQRGQTMKAARQALRLSQARIAEYAGIKDRETIAQYESGLIADITPSVIPALAKALGLSPQQLSRQPWGSRDDAADLRVSPVAKQLAYRFDDYPLALQNQIRAAIASYEALVKVHGKAQVDAMYTPPSAAGPPAPPAAATRPQKRKTG